MTAQLTPMRIFTTVLVIIALWTKVYGFSHTKMHPSRSFINPASDIRRLLFLRALESPQDIEPVPNNWSTQVLSKLSSVIDPDLERDIVSLGFIQNLELDEKKRQISFDVQLTTPACPIKDEFKSKCEDLVNSFQWSNGNAKVKMTAPDPARIGALPNTPFGLSQVKAIIAVSSCKGGVGKSTTAVNLAYSLKKLGAEVGIFDADIYGPSLPTMVTPDNDAVEFIGRQIKTLEREGVKLMSFGYVNDGSAVMRGPMITQLLDQFLSLTFWGPLDYLILDMPPGTGDIQLTLCQKMNITAAVIVTTPQELSFVDVERGIEMFDTVNVPCISVVENMAYLEIDEEPTFDDQLMEKSISLALKEKGIDDETLGESLVDVVRATLKQSREKEELQKLRIFGKGHKNRLSSLWGIEHTFSIPLLDKIAKNGDSGTPFVLEYPESEQAAMYLKLAGTVAREVVKVQYANDQSQRTVAYNSERNLLEISFGNANENDTGTLLPADLRRDCKCAACVEELSGRQILKPEDVPDSVQPRSMSPTGNYALSVDWSDGHRSLYPYKQIRALLRSKREVKVATKI
mmetsp:Transcript_12949/g.24334  ORF Transcript_12949/g.24334 Transcript_12949/m.24334 type:complete len:573 (+) Transcript_12949:182-1900(+)|eukprot:CAMPEP_0176490212 /NCGR_PEP_ID=MMETSP0200_2-20121128/7744_1 /TAXON_ID=947934 /ORGANISM="Chaetoceros sp., Strain GSL56" /LENGTH=572 /DNA_ID=CAMNT_0017887491 /DNA_START=134 /DNA_END=1852 /DNA_ORIENTATION=+